MFKMCNFLAAVAAVLLMVNTSSAEIILAAWDTFGNASGDAGINSVDLPPRGVLPPDFSEFSPGSTFAFGDGARDLRGDRGSDDGTFGSLISGANVDPGSVPTSQDFFLNIMAADDLSFSSFHFDAGNNPTFAGDTWSNVTVSFVDGAGAETELGSRSLLAIAGGDGSAFSSTSNYLDLDFDASGLSLLAGESGAFRFSFFETVVENAPHNAAVHLDNIAITVVDSAAVPEPTSLAVLGILGLGFVTRRRR